MLPHPFTEMDHAETFVMLCAKYGVEPIIQLANEPGAGCEWSGPVPSDWFEVFCGWWCNAARLVIERGATAGFPDGPGYDSNPFDGIEGSWPWWEAGKCIYLGHFYGKNRPPNYPYDDVARWGTPLTEAEHRTALGVFYDAPGWRDDLVEINKQRRLWADAWLTALDDDTCWRGWEQVAAWSEITFGKRVRMALTEGGWTPGTQAGGGPNTDIRYPKLTPDVVAAYTMQALAEDTPLEFQAFWLLADSQMGGAGSWDGDAWVTGSYLPFGYGVNQPIIQALQGSGPIPIPPPLKGEATGEVDAALAHISRAKEVLRG